MIHRPLEGGRGGICSFLPGRWLAVEVRQPIPRRGWGSERKIQRKVRPVNQQRLVGDRALDEPRFDGAYLHVPGALQWELRRTFSKDNLLDTLYVHSLSSSEIFEVGNKIVSPPPSTRQQEVS
jgi:hypothetical protein